MCIVYMDTLSLSSMPFKPFLLLSLPSLAPILAFSRIHPRVLLSFKFLALTYLSLSLTCALALARSLTLYI